MSAQQDFTAKEFEHNAAYELDRELEEADRQKEYNRKVAAEYAKADAARAARSETESYELVYGAGGHGGPYQGYTAALEAAKRILLGYRTETVIYIVPRKGVAYYNRLNAVDEVRRLGLDKTQNRLGLPL